VIDLLEPSFPLGYAQYQAEAENPGLWDDLIFNWHGPLGPTGLKAWDVSGNVGDGTLTNMTPATDWVETPEGWGMEFDGVTEYCQFPRHPVALNASEFTMSSWFVRTGDGAGNDGLFHTKVGTASGAWFRFSPDRTVYFTVFDSVGLKQTGTFFAFTLGVPQLVTGILSGGVISIYVNGSLLVAPVACGNVVATELDISIGRYNNQSFSYDGQVITSSIWNRALELDEIELLTDVHAIVRPRQQEIAETGGNIVTPAAADTSRMPLIGIGV
jgi:hypothetical protein